MTKSIATNRNNDIFVGPDGNLAMVSGLDAIVQNCKNVMETQTGELVLNLPRGVPTLDTIFLKYTPEQFEVAARAMLLTIAGVLSVESFTIVKSRGVARYAAVISTIYGPGVVNG